MVRIVFTKVALFDLKKIVAFIRHGSVKFSIAEKKKILEAISKLTKHPLLGRVVPEIQKFHVRELIFQNYRVVSEHKMSILTVHHHARSLTNNSAFNKEDE